LDPTEQILQGIARIHADVADDLLTRLHGKEPGFFERAVVKLLVAMGYGGADRAAKVTQQSNDEGIDGIIDQDTLGLSRVYVQAKRYAPDQSVGRPEIQAFVGALSGKADGGVFITTGRFSQGAQTYAAAVPTRVILIDGKRLTELMIRYNVGVQEKQSLRIVEIDEDFFE
jgi:restriction system protein